LVFNDKKVKYIMKQTDVVSTTTCLLLIFLLSACMPHRQNNDAIDTPKQPLANGCADYESKVNQATQANDLGTLEELLVKLNRQSDCPEDYLDAVKYNMAQIAATEAENLAQQNLLAEARAWLRRAPTMTWKTQKVHGDIAARKPLEDYIVAREDESPHEQMERAIKMKWPKPAKFYNQAFNLINDSQATLKKPETSEIEKIYRMASEAQILAGNLDTTISRSGEGDGIMSDGRGFIPVKRAIPIQFRHGTTKLDKEGEKSANLLAAYLKKRQATQITLIGHTDASGNETINQKISEQRAITVKNYLLGPGGVTATIDVIGKGESEPLELVNHALYRAEEIAILNRRVEFTFTQ
jgi:outer membrane protein OmpA-like peptidoglycan-associated protein